MKILLTGPTLTSALRDAMGLELASAPPATAQTPIAPIAAGLVALGHQVHIVTTDPSVDAPVRVTEQGVTVSYVPLRGPPKYRARTRALDFFEQEVRYLETEIRAAAPDIVHAHWTYEFAEAAVRSGFPHLVTMHDLGWEYFWQFKDAYRFIRLLMKYRTMPRVRNLTVVAPFMANKARTYGYFGPVTVVPNGIGIPSEQATRNRDLTRPVLVTVGNDGPIKNVRRSIEAFRIVRQTLPNAELHLFGPGLDASFARNEDGVVGHGNCPHGTLMAFLDQRADLLVQTTRFECCPVITMEAKARSVPVVGGRKVEGVSYVCGGEGSVMVDIDNPEEIASGVLGLLQVKRDYDDAAERARLDALNRFSSDVVVGQYVSAYQRVLGPKNQG